MTIEIRREGEINYAKPLARALLRDSRLSFGARGLFAYLWDLPAHRPSGDNRTSGTRRDQVSHRGA